MQCLARTARALAVSRAKQVQKWAFQKKPT